MIAPPPFCTHEISPDADIHADAKGIPASKIPLFQSQDIIEMEMTSDFAAVNKGDKNGQKWPATITYKNGKGKTESVSVQIDTRGNSKRTICADFKPIRVHFDGDKDKYKSTLFAHAGKDMKLATHCSGPGSHPVDDVHNQLVIREYATYRILEEAGIPGFKARLVHMNYKDNRGNKYADGYAFFLEPNGKMAERWGFEHGDRKPAAQNEAGKKAKLVPNDTVNMASFNLGLGLVGGIDHKGNNTVSMRKDGREVGKVFYDLDMSMLANPKFYSFWTGKEIHEPQEDESQIQRFYENYPQRKAAARKFLENALAGREETLQMIDSLPLKEKTFMKARLEEWYSSIEHVINGAPSVRSVAIPQIDNGNYATRVR
jgi:hypothetical protein